MLRIGGWSPRIGNRGRRFEGKPRLTMVVELLMNKCDDYVYKLFLFLKIW
jgi:hypothetical protein